MSGQLADEAAAAEEAAVAGVVQFKNLDTGEARVLPLACLEDWGANDRDDDSSALHDFLAVFNGQKLQRPLNKRPPRPPQQQQQQQQPRWRSLLLRRSVSTATPAVSSSHGRHSLPPAVGDSTVVNCTGFSSSDDDDSVESNSLESSSTSRLHTANKALLLLKRARRPSAPQEPPHPVTVIRAPSPADSSSVWTDVWCVTELRTPSGVPLWAMAVGGLWLAAGAQDGSLSLWRIRRPAGAVAPAASAAPGASAAPAVIPGGCAASGTAAVSAGLLFNPTPDVHLTGHTSSIVACAFDSSESRIASSSLDHTVRIWDIPSANGEGDSKPRSVTIHSGEWVTSLVFHPRQADLLVTASIDGTLQLWKLAAANARKYELMQLRRLQSHVTTLSISPDGALLAVGFTHGVLGLYDSNALTFRAHVECRNRRGKLSNGRKVTGAVWSSDGQTLTVTTSDSRIRVLNINDLSRWSKFKGHVCNAIMLRAELLPGERHIVCPSENSQIYLWSLGRPGGQPARAAAAGGKEPTNDSWEKFKAFEELLTCAATPGREFCLHAGAALLADESLPPPLRAALEKNISHTPGAEAQPLPQPPPPLEGASGASLGAWGSCIIAGSFKGAVRVFLNAGLPRTTTSSTSSIRARRTSSSSLPVG